MRTKKNINLGIISWSNTKFSVLTLLELLLVRRITNLIWELKGQGASPLWNKASEVSPYQFFCWTFKVIFIDNLLWIWNNLNECKLTKACKALVRTLGSLSFAKLANKFCAPTCGSDSNLLGPPSNPWFRWPIRQRHWQRTEKWGSFRCLEEKKKKKLNQITSTW